MKTRPTVDYDLGLKRCSFCKEWLPFDQFGRSLHKNGGCGLRSYCNPCAKIRYPYKPRENPKLQPKQHIFDIRTRMELRQCSYCIGWHPLAGFFMHGRSRSNLCKPCERASARERTRKDVGKHVAAAKRWQAANPEKVKARKPGYQRKYSQANPDKILDKEHRRRATLRAAPQIERIDRRAIIKRDKSTCYLCDKHLRADEVTLDHVIPLSRGGSHIASNLRVACGPCNFSKNNRLLAELATAGAVQIALL